MITIKEKSNKKKKKKQPYYLLKYNYMIGDANGNTYEKVKVSKDNPYLERYFKLLNSLKPVKGTWGIVLDQETLEKSFKEEQITEDDYNFLIAVMFIYDEDESELNLDVNYVDEFYDGVCSDNEYSFLVFEGLTLTYVDENGKKHKTEIK